MFSYCMCYVLKGLTANDTQTHNDGVLFSKNLSSKFYPTVRWLINNYAFKSMHYNETHNVANRRTSD